MNYCILVALLVSMATSSYAVGISGQCDTSADCITTNPQSYCQRLYTPTSCPKGVCDCNTGYTSFNCMADTNSKLYDQSCTRDFDCSTNLCTNNKCACSTPTNTYRPAIASCLEPTRKVFGEACNVSTDCYNGIGDSNGMTCSSTCQCATGYVHRSGFCFFPNVGEACEVSPGCRRMALPDDASLQTETCNSGTCTCPRNSTQNTMSIDGTSYSYCLTKTTAPLKEDGTSCTLHNECASKFCSYCPFDAATKRCLRLSTTSGVSGFQTTTGVLLTFVALKVILV